MCQQIAEKRKKAIIIMEGKKYTQNLSKIGLEQTDEL